MLKVTALIAALALSFNASAAEPVSLEGFSDAIHHWYNRTDKLDAPLHLQSDTRAIADNILLYQRNNGGWPENTHPQRVLSEAEKAEILAAKNQSDASFDNRNIYPQITYLSHAFQRSGDTQYRTAALAGLDFVLSAQYHNGGWPHSPDRPDRAYGDYITFADEVMPGVLSFLRQVQSGEFPFDYIPAHKRTEATQAIAKGDRLILQLQVKVDGAPSIWAGQYHEQTLQPVAARSYELPALQTWESVAVVEYLMSIPKPSSEVVSAVDHAVSWFRDNKIPGVRVEEFAIEPERFEYHTARIDRRLVKDASAPGLWARFYDLTTSEPFFTNRDGSRVEALQDVALERRSGYHWYGTWPSRLLTTDYPRWKATKVNAGGP
ncbi:pectate lyase [Gilvimarinus xylanilyticus]|uniref:Pectate lyase n=1 Tax=Gilvimarinus xylanilyticus TaxID=2944139 RepID=A0A9X2I182_9GAMM|nr:pectate lyase [Gilvimarinus xylanilyticus]MCP8897697.1 pectate lyase [Gilvimarinus xylanilyticus]